MRLETRESGTEFLKATFIHFHQSLLKKCLLLERNSYPRGLGGLFKAFNYKGVSDEFSDIAYEASRMIEAAQPWSKTFEYTDLFEPLFLLNGALEAFRAYADSMVAVLNALQEKSDGKRLPYGEYKRLSIESENLRNNLEGLLPRLNRSFYDTFGLS